MRGTVPNDATQKFTGQLRDQESGMDYFNARYLTPVFGRFNSPDPQNAGASLLSSQSWNGYAYALGNPIVVTDPTGLENDCGGPCTPFFYSVGGGCWMQVTYYPVTGSNGESYSMPLFNQLCEQQSSQGGNQGSSGGSIGLLSQLGSGGSSSANSAGVPIKNCAATPASAGQYVAATAQVAAMTASFSPD